MLLHATKQQDTNHKVEEDTILKVSTILQLFVLEPLEFAEQSYFLFSEQLSMPSMPCAKLHILYTVSSFFVKMSWQKKRPKGFRGTQRQSLPPAGPSTSSTEVEEAPL